MYVCMYVCMCVCVYACMHVHACMSTCMHLRMQAMRMKACIGAIPKPLSQGIAVKYNNQHSGHLQINPRIPHTPKTNTHYSRKSKSKHLKSTASKLGSNGYFRRISTRHYVYTHFNGTHKGNGTKSIQ